MGLSPLISLPSKPWKKVKIEVVAEHQYRIIFLTDMPTEATFHEALEKDIQPCLGASDALGSPDWPSR
jgi:hypothetical protein